MTSACALGHNLARFCSIMDVPSCTHCLLTQADTFSHLAIWTERNLSSPMAFGSCHHALATCKGETRASVCRARAWAVDRK